MMGSQQWNFCKVIGVIVISALTTADMIEALEETGRYRVLDIYRQTDGYHDLSGLPTVCRALYIDTETTGLEHDPDIIELAAVQVEYDPATGRLGRLLGSHSWLEQPVSGKPVPVEVTALTGLTNDMLTEQRIDDPAVLDLLSSSHLVISHNAAFDRPKLETRLPAFARKPWACTVADLDWQAEGIATARLDYVAFRLGFMVGGAHRGEVDCLAGVEVLSRTLPRSGTRAMSALLTRARQATLRVWALGSPYGAKDDLKRRGYRWNDGAYPGSPKAWYRDILETDEATELEWLKVNACCSGISVRLTARDRHSGRAMAVP
jgi:DNA polymerase III subunit epsilon